MQNILKFVSLRVREEEEEEEEEEDDDDDYHDDEDNSDKDHLHRDCPVYGSKKKHIEEIFIS